MRPPMAGRTVIAGLIVAVAGPLIFGVLALLSLLMPECVLGGSGGPAYGCKLVGISFNWLISWATPVFVLSFFTVPAGLLIATGGAIGLLVKSLAARSPRDPKP